MTSSPAVARRRPAMPAKGSPPSHVLGRLEEFRSGDLRWRRGRAFSLAYFAGDEAYELAAEALADLLTYAIRSSTREPEEFEGVFG